MFSSRSGREKPRPFDSRSRISSPSRSSTDCPQAVRTSASRTAIVLFPALGSPVSHTVTPCVFALFRPSALIARQPPCQADKRSDSVSASADRPRPFPPENATHVISGFPAGFGEPERRRIGWAYLYRNLVSLQWLFSCLPHGIFVIGRGLRPNLSPRPGLVPGPAGTAPGSAGVSSAADAADAPPTLSADALNHVLDPARRRRPDPGLGRDDGALRPGVPAGPPAGRSPGGGSRPGPLRPPRPAPHPEHRDHRP